MRIVYQANLPVANEIGTGKKKQAFQIDRCGNVFHLSCHMFFQFGFFFICKSFFFLKAIIYDWWSHTWLSELFLKRPNSLWLCFFFFFQIDLGDRLLPAFNHASKIPFSDVNLAQGQARAPKWGPDSSTSEVTTIQLEFRDLSKITGNKKYEVQHERS